MPDLKSSTQCARLEIGAVASDLADSWRKETRNGGESRSGNVRPWCPPLGVCRLPSAFFARAPSDSSPDTVFMDSTPLVSHWKHSPRVEPARNFIPSRHILAESLRPHSCSSITRLFLANVRESAAAEKIYFPPMKSLLTFSVSIAVECRFVCKPSCRPREVPAL